MAFGRIHTHSHAAKFDQNTTIDSGQNRQQQPFSLDMSGYVSPTCVCCCMYVCTTMYLHVIASDCMYIFVPQHGRRTSVSEPEWTLVRLLRVSSRACLLLFAPICTHLHPFVLHCATLFYNITWILHIRKKSLSWLELTGINEFARILAVFEIIRACNVPQRTISVFLVFPIVFFF